MGRHAVAHDSVVERLPLSGVEPEDLDVAADSGQKRRQRPVLVRPLALASHLTTTTTTIVVVAFVEVVVSLKKQKAHTIKLDHHLREVKLPS